MVVDAVEKESKRERKRKTLLGEKKEMYLKEFDRADIVREVRLGLISTLEMLDYGNQALPCGVQCTEAMFILTMHWDVRLVWAVLSIAAKFYILGLLVAAAYTTYFLTCTVLQLRQVLKRSVSADAAYLNLRLAEMNRGIEYLRQFHIFLFLMFGMFFANEMFALIRTIEYSSKSLSGARIDIFEPVATFAFFVFAVLVLLHVFQWAVATRCNHFSVTRVQHGL